MGQITPRLPKWKSFETLSKHRRKTKRTEERVGLRIRYSITMSMGQLKRKR